MFLYMEKFSCDTTVPFMCQKVPKDASYCKEKTTIYGCFNRISWFYFGEPPEIRTPDTLLKRQVLCRLS